MLILEHLDDPTFSWSNNYLRKYYSFRVHGSKVLGATPTQWYQINPRGGPTFDQLVHTGDLLAAIDGVDGPDSLRQVQVVRQRARQLHQQRVVGSEPVTGHGVHQTLEVAVSVAIEPHLFGLFLRGECLQGSGPVVAAVGAVGGAGDQAAAPGAGPGPAAAGAGGGVIPLGAGGASAANFLTFIEVLQLEGLAQRHDVVQKSSAQILLLKIHLPETMNRDSSVQNLG